MEPSVAVCKQPGAGEVTESPAWRRLRQDTSVAVSLEYGYLGYWDHLN